MKKLFTLSALLIALGSGLCAYSQPVLNSLPVITPTTATIYLDFNGEYVSSSVWNGGNPINAEASGLNNTQITEIFNRVAEDYRPFDINITTDLAKYMAAPADKRIRVIITPTSAWRQGVGGIAWTGSFVWGDDTPCFVFCDRLGPNNPKMVAEACSHESGHTLGLSHQSRYDGGCSMTEVYNTGVGSGEIAWAPVMGNSYYRNMSGWNNGPTQFGCANTQDNLSIITSQNGFTYRVDDYTEVLGTSTTTVNPMNFTINGVISEATDNDAFKFTLAAPSVIHIDAKPFSIGPNNDGANLDIKIQLYNAAKQLIRTYDPAGAMNVTIDSTLNAGTYYLLVDGEGNINVGDYGSLGAYSITGFSGTLPIRDVTLAGTVDKGKHSLSWNIVADEAIKNVAIEVSANASDFNPLTIVTPSATKFAYNPFDKSDLYYRLKVTSVIGQTVYSNTIALKGITKADKAFNVSTFVTNEMVVSASDNYQYKLSTVNGQVVAQGNGRKGINKIDLQNKPAGMYVIQIVSNDNQLTERIIKQ